MLACTVAKVDNIYYLIFNIVHNYCATAIIALTSGTF